MSEEVEMEQIGRIVVEEAMEIFESAGALEDFGVQYVGMATVVFGGSNRLIWKPSRGFYPDSRYCSDKFLKAFCKWEVSKDL